MGIGNGIYKILILDLIGLKFDAQGKPDPSEAKDYIETKGGVFHIGAWRENETLAAGKLHFFYLPDLSTAAESTTRCAIHQPLICPYPYEIQRSVRRWWSPRQPTALHAWTVVGSKRGTHRRL